MTNSEDAPLPAVGVYWIDEEDYPALLKLFADGDRLPRSFEEWRKMAVESPDMIYVKSSHPTSSSRFVAIAATAREIQAKRGAGEPLIPNPRPN